jgi:hypothetical protein
MERSEMRNLNGKYHDLGKNNFQNPGGVSPIVEVRTNIIQNTGGVPSINPVTGK